MLVLALALGGSCLLAAAFNHFELRGWRQTRGAHWTEQARALFPARASRQMNLWALPLLAIFMVLFWAPDIPWWAAGGLAFLGTLAGSYPMDRETLPHLRSSREWARVVGAGLLLQAPTFVVYAVALALMPPEFNARVAVVAAGFYGTCLVLNLGLGVRLLRWPGVLRPPGVRLSEIVRERTQSMGIGVKATWELHWPEATAVALPFTRELIISDRLLEVCPDDEVRAIVAHELGHISEPTGVIMLRVAASFILSPIIFIKPAMGSFGLMGAGAVVAGMCLLPTLVNRFSRRMEVRADRIAQETTAEAGVYARALERLHEVNLAPAVVPKNAGQTHPHLYDRMLGAGVTPAYPRPAAPAEQGVTSFGTVLAVACFVVAWVFESLSKN